MSDRPTNDDRAAWKDYWESQGMPWRTEPELDSHQQELLRGLQSANSDDALEQYPFQKTRLTRADIEWLLAHHASGGAVGPIDSSDPKQSIRIGLDIRGAILKGVDLSKLPLAKLRGGIDIRYVPVYDPARITRGVKSGTLHSAAQPCPIPLDLRDANLDGTDLQDADLTGANLSGASLRDADLSFANLLGANLVRCHCEGARFTCARLRKADMRYVSFDGESYLSDIYIGSSWSRTPAMVGTPHVVLRKLRISAKHLFRAGMYRLLLTYIVLVISWILALLLTGSLSALPPFGQGWMVGSAIGALGIWRYITIAEHNRADGEEQWSPFLLGVRWHEADLGQITWSQVVRSGEENMARWRYDPADGRQMQRLDHYVWAQLAERTYRQLSVSLRTQGLSAAADYFSYRASVMRQSVLFYEVSLVRLAGSLFVNVVSGYGYKPLRTLATYIVVVGSFAVAYLVLGASTGHPLPLNEAVVVSMTAFHGRGFFANAFQASDPQAMIAACEAFVGLLLEVVFIGTFTQRFFAR